MMDSLYKLMPMILSILLGNFIYLKFDIDNKVTNIIDNLLKIKQEWKPFFCVSFSILIIFILGILGIYCIYIPTTLYFIISGLLAGISTGISSKLSTLKK